MKMNDNGTVEQMKGMCERIKDILIALYEGKMYDTENGELVELDCLPGQYDDERYLSLYHYIEDNLGIKIKTDLKGDILYSSEICFAWGGPNIYLDTGRESIDGYWGCDHVSVPLPDKLCEIIDGYIDELREYA